MNALAFLLGVSSILLMPRCLSVYELTLLVFSMVLAGFLRPPWGRSLLMLLFGVAYVSLYVQWFAPKPLPDNWMQQPIQVRGTITSVVNTFVDHQRFILQTDHMNGQPVVARLSLSFWRGKRDFMPGQQWEMTVKLKPPRAYLNPGGFDLAEWAYAEGIQAFGYILPQGPVQLLQRTSAAHWARWRQGLLDRLYQTLGVNNESAMIAGITLGDRSNIDFTENRLFQQTGTSHLLAISGLHVGLLAGMIFFLVRWGLRCCPRIFLYVCAPHIAAVITLMLTFFYIALSGFSVSAVRAYIMLTCVLGAILCARRLRPWLSLRRALWVVLLINPLSVMQAAFWLSFGAAAMLLFLLANRLLANVKKWLRVARLQVCLIFLMIPLSLLYFQQVSLYSPVVNLLAIPWVGCVILPLSVIGLLLLLISPWLGGLLLKLVSLNIHALLFLLQQVTSVQWQLLHAGFDSPWQLICLMLATICLLLPRGLIPKSLCGFLCLPLFYHQSPMPQGSFLLGVFDVGQGLAAMIKTRHHLVLYDTGPRYSASADAGAEIILPYLYRSHIQRVDAIVMSHLDMDHFGGFHHILQGIAVSRVFSYTYPGVMQQFPRVAFTHCQAQAWVYDGVLFQMLSPHKNFTQSNNKACLLRVSAGDYRVLLIGDIEANAERDLVKYQAKSLTADILLVPHHGSTSSSSPVFLAAVQPHLAIVSAGFHNRFGFPKQSIVKRYERLGIQFLNVSHVGFLSIPVSPAGVGPWHLMRIETPRVWRDSRYVVN